MRTEEGIPGLMGYMRKKTTTRILQEKFKICADWKK
jgi:hypothetical protein